ncbi:MAG: septum formation initiator family protein [Clostridia bacterium]|nr:septum formation initiator family protein [Clostridia bacterium]
MATQTHKKTTPKFFLMLTLVCVIVACAVFVSQEQKSLEIEQEVAALQEEYAYLQSEKQRIEYMIEYAQSEAYRIQYAREKLGYVQENDVKFVIGD